MPDSSIIEKLCSNIDITIEELYQGEKIAIDKQKILDIIRLYDKFEYYKIILIGMGVFLFSSIFSIISIPSSTGIDGFIAGVLLGLDTGLKLLGIALAAYGLGKLQKQQ